MSTREFQRALIELVKLPENHRGSSFDPFISKFDLNEIEVNQIKTIISDKFLSSFALKERSNRFALNVEIVFKTSLKLIGKERVYQIYKDEFEFHFLEIDEDEVVLKFKDFLLGHAVLKRGEVWDAYIKDIINYEFCEFQVYGGRIDKNWKVSSDSFLNSKTPFIVQSFDHDVVSYFEMVKMDEKPEKMEKKPLTLLFLRCKTDEGEEMCQFEIDQSLKDFLDFQLKGQSNLNTTLPECYEDLVDLNLCRPLS